jgi:7-cyano-7-deazaguanine synthase
MKNKKSLPACLQAVVLLSGGLDSAVTLYIARDKGYHPLCLIFDYGQRHRREIDSAKKIAQAVGCRFKVFKIDLAHKKSALLDKKINIPELKNSRTQELKNAIPVTYVPARNIIFLSFALSFAETLGEGAVFIGAHAEDYPGYPDCSPEFFRAFERMVKLGTKSGLEGKEIKIFTPLINKKKSEIIREGLRLGVPFGLTWSCYKGGRLPCGKCDSCYYRAKGFRELGIEDPLLVGTVLARAIRKSS